MHQSRWDGVSADLLSLQAGPRLPTEVVAIAAELVIGDGDLHALAILNRACVGLCTRGRCLSSTRPSGSTTSKLRSSRWGLSSLAVGCTRGKCDRQEVDHVIDLSVYRALFVTEITLPLVRLLARHLAQHSPSSTNDLQRLFPRLALVVIEQFCMGARHILTSTIRFT